MRRRFPGAEDSSAEDRESLGDAVAESREGVAVYAVVRVQPLLLAMHQSSLTQESEMVRDGGLLYRDRGFEVAHAHSALVALEHVNQLEPDRVGQDLEVRGEALGLGEGCRGPALRVAAAVAGLPFEGLEHPCHRY